MTTWNRGRLVAVMLLAGAVAGCAGPRPYVSSSENNLRFTTVAESGSWLSSVQASVHIHSVDENCQTSFEGTIPLGGSPIATGIPVGQPSYLVFSFDSSSFMANRSSSITYKTMLTPRRDHDYDIAVEYVEDTYNATIQEVNRRNSRRREVHYTPLGACQA
jgi:hypothetical protein